MSSSESLTELYQAYKESTKYVIAWLSSASSLGTSTESPKTLNSTAELINAAKQVRQHKREVPSSVIHFLCDAIKKRRRVSHIYKVLRESESNEDDIDSTTKHEAFIIRLEDVLQLLLPLRKHRPAIPNHAAERVGIDLGSNQFAVLRDLEDVSLPKRTEQIASMPSRPTMVSKEPVEPLLWHQTLQNGLLRDDDIGEWIELCFFFQELDAILVCLEESWAEAAKDQVAIPLAAWLSTTGLHAVGRICKRISHIAPTYNDLLRKWLSHRHKGMRLHFIAHPELSSQSGGPFTASDAIWRMGQAVNHCRARNKYRKGFTNICIRKDPGQLITRPVVDTGCDKQNSELDGSALNEMLDSMCQLLVSNRGISALELSEQDHHVSEPLLPLLKEALGDDNAPISIPLVFGLQMMLSSYKAFMWLQGTKNERNCRITALKFSQEVKEAMSLALRTIEAIETPYTAERLTLDRYQLLLQERLRELHEFQLERRFDLYYQAPWTAGCHIVEILGVAFSTGLALSCELGYVCAVLHLYNALRRVNRPIQKIMLLDELCQIFLESLFMGDLPKDNFCTRYRRAMGQRLDKNCKPGDTWPSRLSQPTIDLKRRVAPSRISLFYELHASYYQPTIDFWVRAYRGRNIRQPNQAQIHEVRNELHSFAFNIPLNKVKTAVLHLFKGQHPLMRVNTFRIFVFCTNILRDLGTKVHGARQIVSRGHGAPLGYAYVDTILGHIVEHLRDDLGKNLMPFWGELNMTKSIFDNIDANASLSDFLWSI